MTPPYSSDQTALVRRNPWMLGLAASPLALAFVGLLLTAVTGRTQWLVVVPHLLVLGVVLPFLVWRTTRWQHELPARIEANETGIFQDGALLVARAHMRDAFVMPRRDDAILVRVRRTGGARLPIDLRVPSREDGRALLRAIGFDASQAVATFRLPSRLLAEWKWRVAAPAVFMIPVIVLFLFADSLPGVREGVARPVSIALYMFVALAFLVPSRLRVGADGIVYTWLWSQRFIPYGEVDRVFSCTFASLSKSEIVGLEIMLKSGEVVRVPVQRSDEGGNREEVAIVEERIAEAIDTWRRGEGSADTARVGRGGRDVDNWLRALKRFSAGAHVDARTAPILPESLWRIVEDPAAPPDARAGAAVVLGSAIDGEGRARLRAAAEATAAPKLRIAMEAAAKDASEQELAAALAEVEAAADDKHVIAAGP